ncbi:MAG: hypothetical protein ABI528_05420 [bacterium]
MLQQLFSELNELPSGAGFFSLSQQSVLQQSSELHANTKFIEDKTPDEIKNRSKITVTMFLKFDFFTITT